MIKKFGQTVNRSFIKRLIGEITIFNIIMIVLFITMTFWTTKSNTVNNLRNVMNVSSQTAQKAVEDCFKSAGVSIQLLLENENTQAFIKSGSKADAQRVYDEVKKLSEAFNNETDIWCLTRSGEAVTSEGVISGIASYDYAWFAEAEKRQNGTKKMYLRTEGFYSFTSDDYDIAIIVPVFSDNEFGGCIGVEMSSGALEAIVRSSLYSEGVYPVISDMDGKIICSPENAGEFNAIFANSKYTPQSLIAESIKDRTNITAFKSGKVTNYISTTVTNNGWNVSIIYDGIVADGSFRKMYLQQIIILACLFVLEIVATLNVIRHEAKDIPEISSSIAEISSGNYNFRINSASDNELGIIARSVDNLAQSLQEKNAVIEDYKTIDPTTGLQNRYKMYEYMEDLMVSRDETQPRFVLLFIDIDNFKWITETLGHRQGDEFLRIFGQRIKNVVPKVFRFSGDEFVILSGFNDDTTAIEEMVNEIRHQFDEPIEILNDKLYVQFSVGISVYPDDDTNADMLLRDADIAMSRSKEKGKGRLSFYSTSFHTKMHNKVLIAQKLNKALENNEFYLKFQPIITVSNGDIHGFEVLIRWENEELGYVPPFTFVQVAEETGAIVDIGMWIFETACRYLKRMNEYNKDIIMSINVSPVQLKSKNFLDNIKRTIDVFQINPANIQVEITETSLVDFVEGGSNVIQQIADMGIAIALDDFGTGYSSFGYLKDMPIKTLKVDKSFVDEICSKHKDYQITGSIIDMVRNLGIKTVVEGVESIDQYNILSEMKCDYIQGFLMSKPLSANKAMEFVMRYDELHKPTRHSLEENSMKLANEKKKSEQNQTS